MEEKPRKIKFGTCNKCGDVDCYEKGYVDVCFTCKEIHLSTGTEVISILEDDKWGAGVSGDLAANYLNRLYPQVSGDVLFTLKADHTKT